MSPIVQLLAYRFGPDSTFEGQVVGALERLGTHREVRVLDVLFVGRDQHSGEPFAVAAHGAPSGGALARVLTFRLDPAVRERATREVPADLLAAVGENLDVGDAFLAILVAHDWAGPLRDAVERSGGQALPSTFVGQTSFAGLVTELQNLAADR